VLGIPGLEEGSVGQGEEMLIHSYLAFESRALSRLFTFDISELGMTTMNLDILRLRGWLSFYIILFGFLWAEKV